MIEILTLGLDSEIKDREDRAVLARLVLDVGTEKGFQTVGDLLDHLEHYPVGDPRLLEQLTLVQEAGAAVSNLADDIFDAYLDAAGVVPNLRHGRC